MSAAVPRRRTPSATATLLPMRTKKPIGTKRRFLNGRNRATFVVLSVILICTLLQIMVLSVSGQAAAAAAAPSRHPDANAIPKRTIVIVIGSVRGGETTWSSMYKHLLEPNQADLALVVGKTSVINRSSMYRKAKYLYEFEEYKDWADAIDLINGTKWRRTVYPYLNVTPTKLYWSQFLGGVGTIGGSGAIHFMARYWVQQLILEQGLLQKYDRFIVTRSDHYYMCRHDLSLLDNRYVWIPKHEDYFGICDRHVMANASIILSVLNVLPHLINHYEDYNPDLKRRKLIYQDPETFLNLYWQKVGISPWIRRFDRTQFTVKVNDDKTRGSKGVGHSVDKDIESLGLTIKYTPEFYATQCHCQENLAYSSRNWKDQKRGWCLSSNVFTRLVFGVQ